MKKSERIQMIRDNLKTSKKLHLSGAITKSKYIRLKMDAQERISELQGMSKKEYEELNK